MVKSRRVRRRSSQAYTSAWAVLRARRYATAIISARPSPTITAVPYQHGFNNIIGFSTLTGGAAFPYCAAISAFAFRGRGYSLAAGRVFSQRPRPAHTLRCDQSNPPGHDSPAAISAQTSCGCSRGTRLLYRLLNHEISVRQIRHLAGAGPGRKPWPGAITPKTFTPSASTASSPCDFLSLRGSRAPPLRLLRRLPAGPHPPRSPLGAFSKFAVFSAHLRTSSSASSAPSSGAAKARFRSPCTPSKSFFDFKDTSPKTSSSRDDPGARLSTFNSPGACPSCATTSRCTPTPSSTTT